jgi:hypothetical protein
MTDHPDDQSDVGSSMDGEMTSPDSDPPSPYQFPLNTNNTVDYVGSLAPHGPNHLSSGMTVGKWLTEQVYSNG